MLQFRLQARPDHKVQQEMSEVQATMVCQVCPDLTVHQVVLVSVTQDLKESRDVSGTEVKATAAPRESQDTLEYQVG